MILVLYFGIKIKISYHIVILFYSYIDMGGRKAEKQDRPNMTIEGQPGL